ncbi:hypothetical protein HK405_003558 [Cladochytrium tenue]|nr:hypothetical protein HK405_003558 [Cladochytrium tenue]
MLSSQPQPPRAANIHRRATLGPDGIEFRVRGRGGGGGAGGAGAATQGWNPGDASPAGGSSTSGSWATLASPSASTSSLASRTGREFARFQRAQDSEEAAFRARLVSLDRLLVERGAARTEDDRRAEAAKARAREVEEARVEAERARRTIADEFAVVGRQLAARRQMRRFVDYECIERRQRVNNSGDPEWERSYIRIICQKKQFCTIAPKDLIGVRLRKLSEDMNPSTWENK